jgi:hypothetical protein
VEVAVRAARFYVVPGHVVVLADLELALACIKRLITLVAHVGLSVGFFVLLSHLHQNVPRVFLGQFGPELVQLAHKLVGGIVAGSPEREADEAGHPGLHTGSDSHATVLGAALGLPAGCFLVSLVDVGLGVGVDHDGDLRLLVLGLEAHGGGFPVLIRLWHRHPHGLQCRTMGHHVVLSLVLAFEPVQAPGTILALVLDARVHEAIENGDENSMLFEVKQNNYLLCRRIVCKLDFE